MSDKVKLQRSKTAPGCTLWTGQAVAPGGYVEVTETEAAALISRDATEWVVVSDKSATKAPAFDAGKE